MPLYPGIVVLAGFAAGGTAPVLGTPTKVATVATASASIAGNYTVPSGNAALIAIVIGRGKVGNGWGTNGGSATYGGTGLTFRGGFGFSSDNETAIWIGSLASPTTESSLSLSFTITNSPAANIYSAMLVAIPVSAVGSYGTAAGSYLNAGVSTSRSDLISTTAPNSTLLTALCCAQSTAGPFSAIGCTEIFDDSQTSSDFGTGQGIIGFIGKTDAPDASDYTTGASWVSSIGRTTLLQLELKS